MATGRSSKGPEFEVHVLGHPKHGDEGHEGQLGACPFSHRVLLLLEEKEVPYTVNYVDVMHKPPWISEANPQGLLPIIRDLSSGQLLYDSDAITDFLEDKYGGGPDTGKRTLRKLADCPQPAPYIWPKFLAFLGAQQGSQEEEQARLELEEQLQEANVAVPNQSPYVGGHDVCAYDCALAPRLYLARQGCRLLKGWDWATEEHENLRAYLHRMTGRAAWRNTASWDEDCIAADLCRKAFCKMIIDGSRLVVTDNSGAKEVECIKTRGRYASIGDVITCSVKKAVRGKVTQGQVVKAVIVETKKEVQRRDGSVIKFDRNSAVLVNAKGLPIGTRVLGFVTHELRARQMMKVLSLAARVF